jgi:hypothetical protein
MRVRKFLFRLLIVFVVLFVIAGILYLVQMFFHSFDSQLIIINKWIDYVNKAGSYTLIAGVTLGSIIFILAAGMFPLILRGINRKNYWISIQKGLISSFVFYISQIFYKYAENLGRIYFYLAILAIIIITLILIEIITLSMKEEKEEELRTDLIAAISSGLIFGILIRLIETGLHEIKNFLSFMP